MPLGRLQWQTPNRAQESLNFLTAPVRPYLSEMRVDFRLPNDTDAHSSNNTGVHFINFSLIGSAGAVNVRFNRLRRSQSRVGPTTASSRSVKSTAKGGKQSIAAANTSSALVQIAPSVNHQWKPISQCCSKSEVSCIRSNLVLVPKERVKAA